MIEFQSVIKRYGRHLALSGIDLKIEPARTTVLIGPSGCGKSTLLRLAIGLIQPTEGHVLFDGAPLTTANELAVRRRVGYVVQDGGLFPHLSARQNACLMAWHLGWDRDRAEKRVRELADLTAYPSEMLSKFPAELSGGQKQRVSLIRALMLGPEVLLLDEPLGALDPMVRAQLQHDLKAIFANLKQTVLLVTHDMAEAGYFGDQIVLLRSGKVVQAGTLESFRERPSEPFVTEFLNAQRSLVEL